MGMTWICVVGIELSARMQMGLLLIELGILLLFCVWALVKAYAGNIPGSVTPSISWLTPTNFGGVSALSDGLLVAVFLYWGWGTAPRVNEECTDSNTTPGLAGVISTFVLVAIFVLVAFAAQAVHGANYLSNHSDDVLSSTGRLVFGSSGFGDVALKLLIIAVLSSSAASCQTTILPAARTSLSMAMHRAFPAKLGEVYKIYLDPRSRPGCSGSRRSGSGLVIVSHPGGDVWAGRSPAWAS
jgi:amino acid transporter